MEENRPVAVAPVLVDIEKSTPAVGDRVLAIGMGGKLAEVVWDRHSHTFFKAWMPYPKIPQSVKDKLNQPYKGVTFGV